MLLGLCLAGFEAHAQVQGRPGSWAEDGQRALDEGRYRAAFDAFASGAHARPRDLGLYVSAALAASLLGRHTDAEQWLVRALQIEPGYTPASTSLARVLYAQGRLGEAVVVLERASGLTPNDARLSRQLEEWRAESRAQDALFESRSGHFGVRFDGPSDARVALLAIDVLERAYYRVGRTLLVYPSRPIIVVLHTRQRFHDTTRAPAWAGGVFDGRIRVPSDGAFERPEEFRRVLEHELVHAVVSTVAGAGVPAWMHEGLAIALEDGGGAWARERLNGTSRRLGLSRLSESFASLSAADASLAYAESAEMVRAMVARAGTPAIATLLRRLAEGTTFLRAFETTMQISQDALEAQTLSAATPSAN